MEIYTEAIFCLQCVFSVFFPLKLLPVLLSCKYFISVSLQVIVLCYIIVLSHVRTTLRINYFSTLYTLILL